MLTDHAWSYRKSLAWRQTLDELGTTGRPTRPYRPQALGCHCASKSASGFLDGVPTA